MIFKVTMSLKISVVAVCNVILMALMAKTHVAAKLLHVGSSLVNAIDAHMAPFLTLWSWAGVQSLFI